MATSGMTEQLGRVLGGRYRLTAPLGTGSSAQVYLADDVSLRRAVAVKVLHPGLAGDESFLRRFRAEARAAAALSHPNLMAVYDWGEDAGPYLVLELLGGGSLRALLDAGARLTVPQAVAVGLDAARALDAAHRRGFVHRDIKPANLLFGDDGRLRIADFGLARALSEAAWTEPGDGLVGTARYAAPEQATSPRVDGRADVYSLGLVLVEAVTGQVPLTADTALGTLLRRVDAPVPVPEALGPLRGLLERVGRPDPDERPDAAELERELQALADRLEPPAPLPLAGVAVDASSADPTLLPPSGAGTVTVGDGPDPAPAGDPPRPLFDDDVAPPPAAGAVSSRDPGGRRRSPWRWLALLVLLAAVAAAGWFGWTAWLDAQPTTAPVPRVLTLSQDDALAELDAAQAAVEEGIEWSVVVDEDHNENVSAGTVFDQDPPPGTVLEDGGTVRLAVSLGPPPRGVPDLAGRTEAEAEAELEAAELLLGTTTTSDSEDVEAGRVLTWSVDGQERPGEVPKGSEVDLVVSSGPAPRQVPAVAGLPVEEASAALTGLGLTPAVTEQFSTSVPRGAVISASPAEGTTVARGDEVEIVVSLGRDLVVVPEVGGLSIDAAVAALRAGGLTPGDVSGPAGGLVNASDPEAGASVDRGTVVDLFLRR